MNHNDLRHAQVFETLEQALTQPEQVQVLELFGSELEFRDWVVPDSLLRLTNLKRLAIEGYGQLTLPADLAALTSLQQLSLQCTNSDIPEQIFSLTGLTSLTLRTSARTVPDTITRLKNLHTLTLEGVANVPAALGELKHLARLHIVASPINTLPDALAELPSLEHLDLYGCAFAQLPKVVCRMKQLRSLSISNTRIDALPLEIVELKNLEQLIFCKPFSGQHGYDPANCVKQIGSHWCELVSLKHLALQGQRICDVSGNIHKLTQLENLDLSYNDMDAVPEEIYRAQSLKALLLDNNRLTELPQQLGNLTQLEALNLRNNPVSETAALKKELEHAVKHILPQLVQLIC